MRISDWSSDVCSSDLVDFVVPLEELDTRVDELARKIVAKPQRAVMAAKDLVDELWADGVKAAIRRELNQQLALFGRSEERRVGKECVSTCRSRWSPSQ